MTTGILVHAPNWLGDHIMAWPFYYLLKEVFPETKLHLVGRAWISGIAPDFFNAIHPLHAKKPDKPLLKNLKLEQFSHSFSLSPSFRSMLLLKKAEIPVRIGYPTDFRKLLLKYPSQQGSFRIPPYNPFEHRSLSYMRLLTPYFGKEKTAEDYFSKYTKQKYDIRIAKPDIDSIEKPAGFSFSTKNYWIICPGSVAPSKIYPVKHLINIIKMIKAKNPEMKIILIGSSIESQYATQILTGLEDTFRRNIIDLTNQTTLTQALYILKNARGVIANDSGIAHMSFLSDTPLITFLGMGRKEETLALNYKKIVHNLNLSCAPCGKKYCPKTRDKLACLTQISPESVFQSMQQLDKSLL